MRDCWTEVMTGLLRRGRQTLLTVGVVTVMTGCLLDVSVAQTDERPVADADAPPVDPFAAFTDERLRAAVQKACERVEARDEPLTLQSLQKLRYLDIRGQKIGSLAGLEQCQGLTQLRAANNQIVDLGPLVGCPRLSLLDVSGNRVSNLSPLRQASQLRVLLLDGNQVEDLQPLAGCGELQMLRAPGNRITDVSACRSLSKLHALLVADNQITQLVLPATMAALTTVDVSGNQVTDISELTMTPRLNWLFLSGNNIEEVAPLLQAVQARLTAAQQATWSGTVRLDDNPLTDAARAQLEQLRTLGATVTDRVPEVKSEDSEQSAESDTDESKSDE